MAIQIRRGSNAEWEVNNSNIVVGEPAVATDSKRAFIGTASGAYMELANLEAIAPAYDPGNSYMIDDYVSYQGKLHVCTVPTSGAWNASAWQVTTLGQALAENAYSNYETYTMSGDIVSFPNGAGGIPVKDLTAVIEAVQSGSGDPSPTNVRPISGWDEVNVTRTGKNLLPIVDTPTYSGLTIIKNNDGSYTISGKPNSNGSIEFYNDVAKPIRITEPCIFTSEWNPQNSATIIFSTAESSTAIQTSNSDTLNVPIGEYTRFRIYVNSANTYNFTFKPMIRLASVSDATYEPYNGTTYTTDLDGTRYGGTLDVTTGVLTLTWGAKIFDGSESWGTEASANFYSQSGRGQGPVLYGSEKMLCSHAPSLNTAYTGTSLNCFISNSGNLNIQIPNDVVPHTATDMKNWVTAQYNNGNPLTVCFKLSSPQVVQLTPTQVTTLLGQNNIWCDTGAIEKLTYRISNVQ